MGFACSEKQNTENQYVIITNPEADSISQKAALQLQDYWYRISDKTIEIKQKPVVKLLPIYIGKSFLNSSQKTSLEKLKDDGFIISIYEDAVYLAGKNPIGDLYAVNTLLEEKLSCMVLSINEEYIPKQKNIHFDKYEKLYNPAFSFRRILFPGRKSQAFREWYKVEELNDWGMFVHTFNKLIPPKKYYQEHPEYFSLVNGRRLQDAQLCLSNPDVIKTLIENLGEEMKKQPNKQIWSVSQNDTYNMCECNNCQKLYDQYGSYSGAYIYMANQIARAYPNKIISTLAYQFTRSAPKNIEPEPNVNIMFCSIECNRSMPLTEDKRSAEFVQEMKDWSQLTQNIFVWDYVVQFKNYLTPFPNFPVLQPNAQFFRNSGVEMMFEQGSGGNWSDLSELKQYLLAKLLWNPDLDMDSLSRHFIQVYYGKAGKFIQQYYDLTTQEIKNHAKDEWLNIYGFPSDYVDSYLSPKLMLQYKSMMDQAEQAVQQDSVFLDRVKRARLPVDFAFVDIAVNHHYPEMPAIIEGDNGLQINPVILELLDNLRNYSTTHQRIKVSERNFTLTAYRDYVLNKLNTRLKPNKLKNAKIIIKTPYSDTYPVGGAKALNDGLLGPLDYSHNWLGFHGEDMVVEIDLLKETQINEIQMNFLKAVNSWVFLPTNINIESSLDGKNYEFLVSSNGDNSDHHYLVKNIPFVFEFDDIHAKYLRITATSMKTCPEWHRGFGKPSWIFIDEIIVN
jgi:hypothetical protein